jgi:hypothetical protein
MMSRHLDSKVCYHSQDMNDHLNWICEIQAVPEQVKVAVKMSWSVLGTVCVSVGTGRKELGCSLMATML